MIFPRVSLKENLCDFAAEDHSIGIVHDQGPVLLQWVINILRMFKLILQLINQISLQWFEMVPGPMLPHFSTRISLVYDWFDRDFILFLL
jgi:hypothetical protein